MPYPPYTDNTFPGRWYEVGLSVSDEQRRINAPPVDALARETGLALPDPWDFLENAVMSLWRGFGYKKTGQGPVLLKKPRLLIRGLRGVRAFPLRESLSHE